MLLVVVLLQPFSPLFLLRNSYYQIHVPSMCGHLLLLAVLLTAGTTFQHNKKSKGNKKLRIVYERPKAVLSKGDRRKLQDNISNVAKRSNKILTNIIDGLA